jgi:hypothetical protein
VPSNVIKPGAPHPMPISRANHGWPMQRFGDVGHCTTSPRSLDPGFRAWGGAVGEYNGLPALHWPQRLCKRRNERRMNEPAVRREQSSEHSFTLHTSCLQGAEAQAAYARARSADGHGDRSAFCTGEP